jgi:hypothetical protein
VRVRRSSTLLLLYGGVLATSLVVIAGGLFTVVKTSAALSHSAPPDRTLLQSRIESSREIRHALAQPVTIAPLPPITAKPLGKGPSMQAKARPLLSPEAMNAMAMDPSSVPARPAIPDRLTGGGW